MARQYYAVDALSEATTTSATAVLITTLTFTPDANSDYFILFSAEATCDSTADDDRAIVDLVDADNGYALLWRNQIKAHELSGPQDYASVFGVAKVSFGASPGAHSYAALFNSSVAGQTIRVKNVRIIALKAGAGDQFASDNTLATTTSSSQSTYTTLTFTPASTGDYVILAVAAVASDINAGSVATRLNHQTTSVNYGARTTNVIDDYENRVFAVSPKINLANSSQTFNLQFNSPNNSTPVYCLMGAILALRLDGFDQAFQGQDFVASPVNTTLTSYQNALTVAGTPQAVPHLIIGTGAQRIASTSRTSYLQAVGDNPSTTFVEYVQEPANTAAYYTVGFAAITTPANSAANWRWQYKSETTSAAYAADISLLVLRLGAPTVTATASFGAAVQRALAATASADAAAQAGRTAGVAADAAARQTRSIAATLDAAASLLRAAGAAMDAAVRASLNLGLGANAAVQRAFVASASLDAAAQTLRCTSAGFDAAIQAPVSAAIGADVFVAAASSRHLLAACDAAVCVARAATVSLQAAVSADRTAWAGVDVAAAAAAKAVLAADLAVARAGLLATLAVDIAVARAGVVAAGVDGVLIGRFTGPALLDCVVAPAPTKAGLVALAGNLSPVAQLQGIRQSGTALQGELARVVGLQGRIGTDGLGE